VTMITKRLPTARPIVRKTARPLGLVVRVGPSLFDRKPTVVVLTGFRASKNRKTGKMLQAWILREDISPTEAVQTAGDFSICGDCKHRGQFGERSCYVVVPQAPLQVWKTYHAGSYTDAQDWTVEELAAVIQGRKIRFGAYGDPAAAPVGLWRKLATASGGWTGYTHQWLKRRSQGLSEVIMASADTVEERAAAAAKGWRTFRVRAPGEALEAGEISCPASPEAGERTNCADCGLCKGQARPAKSISILVHGSGASKFEAARENELVLV